MSLLRNYYNIYTLTHTNTCAHLYMEREPEVTAHRDRLLGSTVSSFLLLFLEKQRQSSSK